MSLDALDNAFEYYGLRILNTEVVITNMLLFEMHKKVCIIQEGYIREYFFNGEKNMSIVHFGLLISEWSLA